MSILCAYESLRTVSVCLQASGGLALFPIACCVVLGATFRQASLSLGRNRLKVMSYFPTKVTSVPNACSRRLHCFPPGKTIEDRCSHPNVVLFVHSVSKGPPLAEQGRVNTNIICRIHAKQSDFCWFQRVTMSLAWTGSEMSTCLVSTPKPSIAWHTHTHLGPICCCGHIGLTG